MRAPAGGAGSSTSTLTPGASPWHITAHKTIKAGESYVVAGPMEIDAGINFEYEDGGHVMVL